MPGNFVSLFVCFCFPRKHQPEMTYRSNSMIPLSETITCSYHNKHNTVLVLAKDILFITRDATTSLRILDVVRGFLFFREDFPTVSSLSAGCLRKTASKSRRSDIAAKKIYI